MWSEITADIFVNVPIGTFGFKNFLTPHSAPSLNPLKIIVKGFVKWQKHKHTVKKKNERRWQ